MTDLSWEVDAESRCEALVTEALLVAPYSAEALQTLASVRISQGRIEEARKALEESIKIWQGKEDGEGKPEFAVRVSLSRLLMEVGMLGEGMEVLEGLVEEDDGSVEAWYLGGWCLFLGAAEKRGKQGEEIEVKKELRASRDWLNNSLRLYHLQEYEDERLKEHVMELIGGLEKELGDENSEEDDEEWEDESGDSGENSGNEKDQHMKGT